MDPSKEGAMASSALPSWDKENPEEAGLFCMSVDKNLIKENRVKLREELEPDRIWAHLRQLNVLDKCKEETLRWNPRPQVVMDLLDHIERGPKWHFHGFCRALALTGQSDLIPRGRMEPKVYEEGALAKQLPNNLVKLIREHCRSNIESLMKKRLFDFEGDPEDATIDISQFFVPVDPTMKGNQQKMIAIQTKQILEQLQDKVPPQVVRMYGDPGDGKTSLMMHIARYWSAEFLKLSDEELSSKCPRWNTIVYLSAPKIKGTVEEAIWDELGCKESDADTLMDHVKTGDGTGVFIDSLDEVRDRKVIENIKRYVHQRKKKGGPTVLIAARTDLCPIDANDIDRTITVQGFTEAQGLEYVKQYTAMCEVPQQPEQPPLVEYVTQYREELKSVLTNPLRLYIFSALAVRGQLDLANERVFNIPKLFGPLERFLLRREGSEVTALQRRDFYRLCMDGLLHGLREFPESLLAKFNIAKAYYIFLRRSSRRDPDGVSAVYYSFSHEVLYEYFASRYIHSLSTEQKKSLLLLICSNEQLRNVQYIVFQLLLQEWETQKDLIVSMIRCMLILQFTAPRNNVDGNLIKLMSLRYMIPDISLEDMLNTGCRCKLQEINNRNSAMIWREVNDTFERRALVLLHSDWFGYVHENGTVKHVMKCLQACLVQQQEELFRRTISQLLPCTLTARSGDMLAEFFPVSSTRWGRAYARKGQLHMVVWCPADAARLLEQYLRKHSRKRISKVHISFDEDSLPGKAVESAWSKDAWYTLTSELTALDELSIRATAKTPLEGMLSCLTEYAPRLEHSMKVTVDRGTVQLGVLENMLVRCKEVPKLTLELTPTLVVVPSEQDEKVLIAQRNLVCSIGKVEPCHPYPGIEPMHGIPVWQTESRERYVWSDCMWNFHYTNISFRLF